MTLPIPANPTPSLIWSSKKSGFHPQTARVNKYCWSRFLHTLKWLHYLQVCVYALPHRGQTQPRALGFVWLYETVHTHRQTDSMGAGGSWVRVQEFQENVNSLSRNSLLCLSTLKGISDAPGPRKKNKLCDLDRTACRVYQYSRLYCDKILRANWDYETDISRPFPALPYVLNKPDKYSKVKN